MIKKVVLGLCFLAIILLVGCQKNELAKIEIIGNDEVFIEETLQLGIKIDGEIYQWQNNEVIWTVSNYDIANIEDGILIAKNCGEIIVGAVFKEDSRFYATKKVAIVNPRVTSIEVTGPIEVEEDKSVKLQATVFPPSIVSELNWSSSDENILTVVNGVVYGRKTGSADVIVECDGFEVRYPMTVLPLSTILEINAPIEVEVGMVVELISNIGDSIFTSSDSSIGKILGNSFCAIKEGKVTIYGYSERNNAINGTFEISVISYSHISNATAEETETINNIINSMTIEQLIGQMFIVSCEAIPSYNGSYYLDDLTGLPLYYINNRPYTAENLLSNMRIGNYYVNYSNALSGEYLSKVITSYQRITQGKTEVKPFIFSGFGDNLSSSPAFTPFLSNIALGASQRPNNAYQMGEIIGLEMNSYGINGSLSSYIDLSSVGSLSPSMSIFSSNAKESAIYGQQLIQGYQQNKISLIPNVGGYTYNYQNNASLTSFQNNELFLIRSAIQSGCNIISLSNTTWSAIDSVQLPFSSTFINDYIRADMNYDGVIMSDLSVFGANNLNNLSASRALEAIQAGVDMLSVHLVFNRNNSYSYINDLVYNMYNDLIGAAYNGQLSTSRVREAVSRILLQKLRQGILNSEQSSRVPDFSNHLIISQEISQDSLTIVGNVPKLDSTISTLVITQPYTITNTTKTLNDFGSCFTAFFNQRTSYRNYKVRHIDIETESNLLSMAASYDYIIVTIASMTTIPLVNVKNEKTLYTDLIKKLYDINPNIIAVVLQNPGDANYVSFLDNYIFAYNFYDTNFETIFRYLNNEFTNKAKYPF